VIAIRLKDPDRSAGLAHTSQLLKSGLADAEVMQHIATENGVERVIPKREGQGVAAHKSNSRDVRSCEHDLSFEQVKPDNGAGGSGAGQEVHQVPAFSAADLEHRAGGDRKSFEQFPLGSRN